MNLLAIDTSTERACVALVTNNVFTSQEQGALRQHAQLILPMIDKLLSDANIALKQLDGIVFGCGPGSFTGLRIACSVAKGLAYAHDLPLYPVTSLAAIANEVMSRQTGVSILSMIDARMNQVYWAYYEGGTCDVVAQVSHISDIKIAGDLPMVLAGVGYHPYLDEMPAAIAARIINTMEIYPDAIAMLRLVLGGKIKAVTASEALPVYVRNKITGEPRG